MAGTQYERRTTTLKSHLIQNHKKLTYVLYSGDGRDGSTKIRQDAEILFGETDTSVEIFKVDANQSLPHGSNHLGRLKL